MFTSYYANLKKLPKDLVPVSISVGKPRWWKGRHEPRLCPTWAMLKMSPAKYDRHFKKILDQLDPQAIFEELGDNAVLLCWEKPPDRCHRRCVAEWSKRLSGSKSLSTVLIGPHAPPMPT